MCVKLNAHYSSPSSHYLLSQMRMRRSKRSAQDANEEEAEEPHHEADDHHHHHHDDGDDHRHHDGVNEDQDPWSWMRLEGTNRSRRDVRYVPKFIETALVLDKAMVS